MGAFQSKSPNTLTPAGLLKTGLTMVIRKRALMSTVDSLATKTGALCLTYGTNQSSLLYSVRSSEAHHTNHNHGLLFLLFSTLFSAFDVTRCGRWEAASIRWMDGLLDAAPATA